MLLMDQSLDHRSTFGNCGPDNAGLWEDGRVFEPQDELSEGPSPSGARSNAYGVREDDQTMGRRYASTPSSGSNTKSIFIMLASRPQ